MSTSDFLALLLKDERQLQRNVQIVKKIKYCIHFLYFMPKEDGYELEEDKHTVKKVDETSVFAALQAIQGLPTKGKYVYREEKVDATPISLRCMENKDFNYRKSAYGWKN